MARMNSYVKMEISDKIVLLTINRPGAYNAINLPTAQELAEHLVTLGSNRQVQGIIITGAGTAFSAGGDIRQMMNDPDGPAATFSRLAAVVNTCITEIRRMRKPVVAAVNGIAAGGGFSLALACDFRVIAGTARLKQGFTTNGLCIDGGGTFLLPRLVGLARALEIAALDEPITAEEALTLGLVNRVVEPDEVVAASRRLVDHIRQKSLHTFGWSKLLLTNAFETPLEAQLEMERQGLFSCAAHADGQEGMKAFLEKRAPRFNQ